MDVEGTVVWGFAGTAILTMILRISQAIGLTRMDLPLMIGLFVTPSRDRAKAYGLGLHMISGWIAALMYGVLFENMGWANWRTGALIGVVHALIVLLVLLPIMPGLHPRMATDARGPEPTRELEPPGFMAVNYGRETPIVTILAHIVFGALLGGFYRM